MGIEIIAALIAGFVSLVVSILSSLVTSSVARKRIHHETDRLEREIQRSKTDRLYELRLSCYPNAFRLTEPLLATKLFSAGIDKKTVQEVLNDLNEWKANEATFIMSKVSHKSFYHIRRTLMNMLEMDSPYTDEVIQQLFEAKNSFRKSLQTDVGLLFEEEPIG